MQRNYIFVSAVAKAVKFHADRGKLVSASPVFEAMFSGRFKEEDIVEVTDTDPAAFKKMLQ